MSVVPARPLHREGPLLSVSNRLVKSTRRPLSPPQMLKLRDVDIVIVRDRCKGCSYCIEFCPKKVLEQDKKLNSKGVRPPRVKDATLCVGCGVCEELCPDFAIFLVDKRGAP